jgi:hypothetical protein
LRNDTHAISRNLAVLQSSLDYDTRASSENAQTIQDLQARWFRLNKEVGIIDNNMLLFHPLRGGEGGVADSAHNLQANYSDGLISQMRYWWAIEGAKEVSVMIKRQTDFDRLNDRITAVSAGLNELRQRVDILASSTTQEAIFMERVINLTATTTRTVVVPKYWEGYKWDANIWADLTNYSLGEMDNAFGYPLDSRVKLLRKQWNDTVRDRGASIDYDADQMPDFNKDRSDWTTRIGRRSFKVEFDTWEMARTWRKMKHLEYAANGVSLDAMIRYMWTVPSEYGMRLYEGDLGAYGTWGVVSNESVGPSIQVSTVSISEPNTVQPQWSVTVDRNLTSMDSVLNEVIDAGASAILSVKARYSNVSVGATTFTDIANVSTQAGEVANINVSDTLTEIKDAFLTWEPVADSLDVFGHGHGDKFIIIGDRAVSNDQNNEKGRVTTTFADIDQEYREAPWTIGGVALAGETAMGSPTWNGVETCYMTKGLEYTTPRGGIARAAYAKGKGCSMNVVSHAPVSKWYDGTNINGRVHMRVPNSWANGASYVIYYKDNVGNAVPLLGQKSSGGGWSVWEWNGATWILP